MQEAVVVEAEATEVPGTKDVAVEVLVVAVVVQATELMQWT
jgi:hypothetical protein